MCNGPESVARASIKVTRKTTRRTAVKQTRDEGICKFFKTMNISCRKATTLVPKGTIVHMGLDCSEAAV